MCSSLHDTRPCSPVSTVDAVHHAALCSLRCSTGTYRLLFRATELFHVFVELGDGRKNVGFIGKFDGMRLVAVAGGGRGAGRYPSRW